jgi:hypothetical protein
MRCRAMTEAKHQGATRSLQAPGRRNITGRMDTVPPRRVWIEFAGAIHPIRGMVADEDGRRRQFSGWIELVQAIDAVRAVPHAAADLGAQCTASRASGSRHH